MAKSKRQKQCKTSKKERVDFKNWLSNNKIYFETVMALSLTIMGILISIISLSFQQKANDLQEMQSFIEKQLNMPVFNVSKTSYYEDYSIDGITYPAGTEVKIINNGGNISNGYLNADAKIEVIVHDKDHNVVGTVVAENTQRYLKGYSYYDAQSKSFTIKTNFDTRNIELRYFLDQHLENDYKNYYFTLLISDYVNIQYYDFQNQYHNEWYELNGGDLLKRTPIASENHKFLEINTMTNEEVYTELKEMIDVVLDIE